MAKSDNYEPKEEIITAQGKTEDGAIANVRGMVPYAEDSGSYDDFELATEKRGLFNWVATAYFKRKAGAPDATPGEQRRLIPRSGTGDAQTKIEVKHEGLLARL